MLKNTDYDCVIIALVMLVAVAVVLLLCCCCCGTVASLLILWSCWVVVWVRCYRCGILVGEVSMIDIVRCCSSCSGWYGVEMANTWYGDFSLLVAVALFRIVKTSYFII